MAERVRIGTIDPRTKEVGSTTAYLIEARNHLLQTRRFAFDGRYWYYQPTSTSRFQMVNVLDLPDNAVDTMSAHTGIPKDHLNYKEYPFPPEL